MCSVGTLGTLGALGALGTFGAFGNIDVSEVQFYSRASVIFCVYSLLMQGRTHEDGMSEGKILIVDEDAAVRQVTAAMLERLNYTAVAVAVAVDSGAAALTTTRKIA